MEALELTHPATLHSHFKKGTLQRVKGCHVTKKSLINLLLSKTSQDDTIYIPIDEAVMKLGYTDIHTRRLVSQGKLYSRKSGYVCKDSLDKFINRSEYIAIKDYFYKKKSGINHNILNFGVREHGDQKEIFFVVEDMQDATDIMEKVLHEST